MLENTLRAALQGDVRFDVQAKALYATDASNYRQVPIGVVIPKTREDVIRTVEICRREGVPILSRGTGTSLAGQCCNVAVIVDMSKYLNKILEIDASNHFARVEPGVILDHLRREAEKYGLTFGPDPATHSRCTLGGMIGNNSCGVHAVAWGKTVDNVESLQIHTYDGLTLDVGRTSEDELSRIIRAGGPRGEIYSKLQGIRDRYAALIRARFPKIPRRVSGYNLDELLPENGFNVARALVGTEGTCVTILEAKLRLIPNPPARSLVVLGFKTIYEAAKTVPEILTHKPIGLEGMDLDLVTNLGRYQGFMDKIKLLPPGEGWLLIEFGGASPEESDGKARDLTKKIRARVVGPLSHTSREAKDIWAIRESVLAATAFVPGQRDRHEGWEDAAVPPDRLGAYLPELRALYNKYGYRGAFYGHFGDGCIHTRIDFDLDSAQGRHATRAFLDEAADLVVRYGGSLSGEHGDGQARAELLPKMFGPEIMKAFQEFKSAWDPQGRMNPGKVVKPNGILDNLRIGNLRLPQFPSAPQSGGRQRENFTPARPETHFQFPKQENSFIRAVLRCVGVGKCRNDEGGLMCPSYMATREEKHSTRGRAHLLFEMLKGEVIKDGWKSEEVKEALDLCLSCKGCKSDCPTNVDMATYKAEFLSHYYEGRLRPRHAYAFGYIEQWARLGSNVPRMANILTQTPGLSHAAKFLTGISQKRKIPKFANETFQRWFQGRSASPRSSLDPLPHGEGGSGPGEAMTVLLWPDTYTNYFQPGIGQAAVEVLEHLGFQVVVPETDICCGRPLYDFGFLDQAESQLRTILKLLGPQLETGLPLAVLEPSCAAVFRDELVNLFPNDPLAHKLHDQTVLLSEFLLPLMSSPEDSLPAGRVPGAGPTIKKADGSLTAASGMTGKNALVQPHCHHQSVLGFDAEKEILLKLGLNATYPEAGCCGMAGSFGFATDHYDISMQIGERTLLPAVRRIPEETLIIADGFSCREQITQTTGRKALHLAEVLNRALHVTKR